MIDPVAFEKLAVAAREAAAERDRLQRLAADAANTASRAQAALRQFVEQAAGTKVAL